MDVSGTHAYIADYLSGLQVIDITDPASPQIVGSLDTPGVAFGVAVSGTHAYIADWSGLQVINTTYPTTPYNVGSVDTPGDAYGVAVSGTHAYVADYLFGLQVVDITFPAHPQIVGGVIPLAAPRYGEVAGVGRFSPYRPRGRPLPVRRRQSKRR